jgi:hypothetical protein
MTDNVKPCRLPEIIDLILIKKIENKNTNNNYHCGQTTKLLKKTKKKRETN